MRPFALPGCPKIDARVQPCRARVALLTPPRVAFVDVALKSTPARVSTSASAQPAPQRDLLRMADFGADLENVLDAARALKRSNKTGHPTPLLPAKSAVLIFEKASTRTRA